MRAAAPSMRSKQTYHRRPACSRKGLLGRSISPPPAVAKDGQGQDFCAVDPRTGSKDDHNKPLVLPLNAPEVGLRANPSNSWVFADQTSAIAMPSHCNPALAAPHRENKNQGKQPQWSQAPSARIGAPLTVLSGTLSGLLH